jgi:hypothetical protein
VDLGFETPVRAFGFGSSLSPTQGCYLDTRCRHHYHHHRVFHAGLTSTECVVREIAQEMNELPFWVPLLIFAVATLYSSVGHGGASGYLAVLSLLAISRTEMATTALVLNILVAGTALVSFMRSKHLRLALTWPFILLSIPGAVIGGAVKVSEGVYSYLLAFALLAAAIRLSGLLNRSSGDDEFRPLRLPVAVPLGGGIGLLSGIVGIGGGVFLSPVILFAKWADAKKGCGYIRMFHRGQLNCRPEQPDDQPQRELRYHAGIAVGGIRGRIAGVQSWGQDFFDFAAETYTCRSPRDCCGQAAVNGVQALGPLPETKDILKLCRKANWQMDRGGLRWKRQSDSISMESLLH